ncbi:DUF507 family protein [Helicobacter ailurogastricus]|uniref:Competence/damage-inducible domain protein n=1 Tax=Helicobacter ailurogastricus TaxID=1578720 RepID=A0A0K2X6A7_9HELI|nr:DUF507 family protein [Helicobacter ailurogastricus]CRF40831.1 Hypothetical protein probably associated with Carbamoyl-phosphate synthase [Helicobacter ailurogastricus]CRF42870.1 Hypothetical protein probably associated with Carbamoyl-phosphate synthase [Helicobacter ailurogastricus]CRF44064.1 Hypothetical protein probably associated with Carbamoyl-phosphate synthase [Helicobacter ailurogastricus]GLH57295.1 Competence protein [Helicobacter ailurogastricus]GLH59558.1 Competence protein [Heli
MRLKANHVRYIVSKITQDLVRSPLLELKGSLETLTQIAQTVLQEHVSQESSIDNRVRDLLEENLDQIEFMRMDERQLFWNIKKQIALERGFVLGWEDRCNVLSHKILEKILDEDLIMFSVSENRIRNVIFKSIDTYAKLYESVETEVSEKIKHYKRRLPVGSDEYELVFERMYEDELRRKGFL